MRVLRFKLARSVRRLIRPLGIDYQRFTPAAHPVARLHKLLGFANVDLVLDVGANQGQFAQELRVGGYRGRMLSFEPISKVYQRLLKNVKGDQNWQCLNCGIGDQSGTETINIAGNEGLSSSFLEMLPAHEEQVPDSAYVRAESVEIKRLDECRHPFLDECRNAFLKIDTQGFEKRVLAGAEGIIEKVAVIYLESSLIPLYEQESPIEDILRHVRDMGYDPYAIEPGYSHPGTGRMLQVDIAFLRSQ